MLYGLKFLVVVCCITLIGDGVEAFTSREDSSSMKFNVILSFVTLLVAVFT